jgi:hypothetical protein
LALYSRRKSLFSLSFFRVQRRGRRGRAPASKMPAPRQGAAMTELLTTAANNWRAVLAGLQP